MKNVRTFTQDDQMEFAALTGDFNPMHVDPIAARRTQAGAPVVHGIHALLWLIECLANQNADIPSIAEIKVRFVHLIHVGDQVEAVVTKQNQAALHAEIRSDGIVVYSLRMNFGLVSSVPLKQNGESILPPKKPFDHSLEDMVGQSGVLAFVAKAKDIERKFPQAARMIGAPRLAALGSSTSLVGMILPGLHSLYAGLSLSFCEIEETRECLSYRVTKVDQRFRLVRLEIIGGGLSGKLETFARHPPVTQATLETIAPLVSSDEFISVRALVIGGSRGLGELTAKIIAAGGGDVTITYSVSKAAAESVAAEIISFGGRCQIISYDVLQDAGSQVSRLATTPTDIYYFATPAIFRGRPKVFSQSLFDTFSSFYVDGFRCLIEACFERYSEGFRIFYPSSIAIDEQTSSMEEYVKSKVEGEKLCIEIEKKSRKVRLIFSRLPRLPTDQTATVQSVVTADPLATLLPIIRKLSAM